MDIANPGTGEQEYSTDVYIKGSADPWKGCLVVSWNKSCVELKRHRHGPFVGGGGGGGQAIMEESFGPLPMEEEIPERGATPPGAHTSFANLQDFHQNMRRAFSSAPYFPFSQGPKQVHRFCGWGACAT